MTEEEKLQKAYFVLGLQPGDPMDKVIRRHKRLIMVWHPDRFPNEDGKKDAEEELKQINNAKDDLKNHFEKNHKAGGSCACRPAAGASSQQSSSSRGTGPGPGKRKTTQETNREEAEAQRRSREREAASAAEAAEKERQRQSAASAAAQKQTAQQAVDQAKVLADERLRWKVSLCIGAAWVALSVFGWAGTSLKSWWHDFSWKWERDHAPQQQYKAPDTSTNTNPYVPPYRVAPGGSSTNNTSPFGQVGPPPTDQTNSPYSTLDSFNKQSSSNTQPPPNLNLTPAPTNSGSIFQRSTPNLFPTDQNSLRQNASDFLNSGSSPPSKIDIPYTPHVMPTNTTIAPSSGVGNTFSQTLDDINKKSGQ
ncbi:MAG: DnaJ domain-containing protein [Cyanobacteria bacterium REEB67]|nr:DnaJ domain-containing protein [Cyanobacteria bacterium REEB67]